MENSTRTIHSVNVGTPRQVATPNGAVLTSIFKEPVDGRVAVRGHNVAGDRQSDLTVHGGPHKAVYLYASEHYDYWTSQLPGMTLRPGMFGENLTAAGMQEDTVLIGDRYRVGSAVLQVTQPRMPCFKLALRLGRSDMVKMFWLSGRSGIYFSVVEEGELGAGDRVELVASGPERVTVADVVRLYRGGYGDPELRSRAVRAPLFGGWKRGIQERMIEHDR